MKMRCVVFTDWVASGRLQALQEGDEALKAQAGPWVRFGLWSHPWICGRCRAFQNNDAMLGNILEAQQERWREWAQVDADEGAASSVGKPAPGQVEPPAGP